MPLFKNKEKSMAFGPRQSTSHVLNPVVLEIKTWLPFFVAPLFGLDENNTPRSLTYNPHRWITLPGFTHRRRRDDAFLEGLGPVLKILCD